MAPEAPKCEHCHTLKPDETDWLCATCTFVNEDSMDTCQMCLSPKPITSAKKINVKIKDHPKNKKARVMSLKTEKTWACPACAYLNTDASRACKLCQYEDNKRPVEVVSAGTIQDLDDVPDDAPIGDDPFAMLDDELPEAPTHSSVFSLFFFRTFPKPIGMDRNKKGRSERKEENRC